MLALGCHMSHGLVRRLNMSMAVASMPVLMRAVVLAVLLPEFGFSLLTTVVVHMCMG
jgi:hypothetical protein